jgi:hypothetical protein
MDGVANYTNTSKSLSGSGSQKKPSVDAKRAQFAQHKNKGVQRGKLESLKVQAHKIGDRISQLLDRLLNWLRQPDAPVKEGTAALSKLAEAATSKNAKKDLNAVKEEFSAKVANTFEQEEDIQTGIDNLGKIDTNKLKAPEQELHAHFHNTLKAQQVDKVSKRTEKLSFQDRCEEAVSALFDAVENHDKSAKAKFDEFRAIAREVDVFEKAGIHSCIKAGLEGRSSDARVAICKDGAELLSHVDGYLAEKMSDILLIELGPDIPARALLSAGDDIGAMKDAADLLTKYCIAKARHESKNDEIPPVSHVRHKITEILEDALRRSELTQPHKAVLQQNAIVLIGDPRTKDLIAPNVLRDLLTPPPNDSVVAPMRRKLEQLLDMLGDDKRYEAAALALESWLNFYKGVGLNWNIRATVSKHLSGKSLSEVKQHHERFEVLRQEIRIGEDVLKAIADGLLIARNVAAAAQFIEGVRTNKPELTRVEFFNAEHLEAALEGKSKTELQALFAACNEWLKDPKPSITDGMMPTELGVKNLSRVLTAKGIGPEPELSERDERGVAATKGFFTALLASDQPKTLELAFFGPRPPDEDKSKLYHVLREVFEEIGDYDVPNLSIWSKDASPRSVEDLSRISERLDLIKTDSEIFRKAKIRLQNDIKIRISELNAAFKNKMHLVI